MDDVRIEKWVVHLEANEAARNDRRKGRQKIRKVVKKKDRVRPESESPREIAWSRRPEGT